MFNSERSGDACDVVKKRRRARRFALLIGLFVASSASAQLAVDVSVASDNDFRGNSLSNHAAVVAVAAAFDHPDGWFTGAMASEARFRSDDRNSPQLVTDAGYAHRLSSGLSWEAGATSTFFPNASIYNYAEVFAGLAADTWSARLYVSPDYYGRNFRSEYLEFNVARPLGERLRLLGHIGAQHSETTAQYGSATTFDVRLGVSAQLGFGQVQLAWVQSNRVGYLEPVSGHDRRRWIVSVTHAL
jgi:uncharacterized protein (TIGR02001 family)